jgi:hypothetical protein
MFAYGDSKSVIHNTQWSESRLMKRIVFATALFASLLPWEQASQDISQLLRIQPILHKFNSCGLPEMHLRLALTPRRPLRRRPGFPRKSLWWAEAKPFSQQDYVWYVWCSPIPWYVYHLMILRIKGKYDDYKDVDDLGLVTNAEFYGTEWNHPLQQNTKWVVSCWSTELNTIVRSWTSVFLVDHDLYMYDVQ